MIHKSYKIINRIYNKIYILMIFYNLYNKFKIKVNNKKKISNHLIKK